MVPWRMRRGQLSVVLRALREGRAGWLARQSWKYMRLKAALRRGQTAPVCGPLMGALIITNRCNLRCAMCDLYERIEKPELSADQWRRVIDEMAAIGTSGIGISGGEALLHPQCNEFIARIRGHGLPATLNTNALLLADQGRAEAVVKADPTNVNISIDGATAATHDKIRGREGALEMALQGMRNLAAEARRAGSGMTITAVTVVNRQNKGEVADIARLAAANGAQQIGFMPSHNVDLAHQRCVVAADPEMVGISKAVFAAIDQVPEIRLENSTDYVRDFDLAYAGKEFPLPCNAGHTSLMVDSGGRVYPCWTYFEIGRAIPGANINQGGGLREIWQSAEYAAMRAETARCRMCYWNCQAELNYLVRG